MRVVLGLRTSPHPDLVLSKPLTDVAARHHAAGTLRGLGTAAEPRIRPSIGRPAARYSSFCPRYYHAAVLSSALHISRSILTLGSGWHPGRGRMAKQALPKLNKREPLDGPSARPAPTGGAMAQYARSVALSRLLSASADSLPETISPRKRHSLFSADDVVHTYVCTGAAGSAHTTWRGRLRRVW